MTKAVIASSVQPPAVAYLRLSDDEDPAALASLLKQIAACCLREGLHLVRTCVDRGYDGTQLARPGIVQLQQTLKETRGMAVVLPTLEHLSPATAIREALVRMVSRLEGELILANDQAIDGSAPTQGEVVNCGGDGHDS